MDKRKIEYTVNSISYYVLYVGGLIYVIRFLCCLWMGSCAVISIWILLTESVVESWKALLFVFLAFLYGMVMLYWADLASTRKVLIDREKFQITGKKQSMVLSIPWSTVSDVELLTEHFYGRTYLRIYADIYDGNCTHKRKRLVNLILESSIDRQKLLDLIPDHIFVNISE